MKEEVQTGSIEWVRQIIRFCEEFNLSSDFFFSQVLEAYYSPLLDYVDGLARDAGHLIYRLSDQLAEEQRQSMHIYPDNNGNILIEDVLWGSLEDWRREWESRHPDIPRFSDLISARHNDK